MPCSAVTLSLATITGIIATGLLAIAFSTDNWLYTEVKRAQIQVCESNLFFLQVFFFTTQLWNLSEEFRMPRCAFSHLPCFYYIFYIISFKFHYLWNVYYRSYVVFTWFLDRNVFSRCTIALWCLIDDFYKSVCRIWFLNDERFEQHDAILHDIFIEETLNHSLILSSQIYQ